MDFWKEFQKLRETSPRLSLRATQCENSDYTNYSVENRNCYLVVSAAKNEDCYYGNHVIRCRDSVDNNITTDSELCYECVNCEHCYNSNFLEDCRNVQESWFCADCISCSHCFGCVSLRNKKYMMFNEVCTKEEYEKRLRSYLTPTGIKEAQKKFKELQLKTPRVFARQINCENSMGDYLRNVKNCFFCFDAEEVEDGMYLDRPLGAKDCIDCSFLYTNCSLDYMVVSAIGTSNTNFSFVMDHCYNCEYCMSCFNSHHLFGCISRNHAEYEILNQKYSPDEWFKKVREIKKQMKQERSYGKMLESDFPMEDTIVQEYLQ